MDKTNHQQAELTESTFFNIEFLNNIFKHCPEGIIFRDSNLKYVMMNDSFKNFFSISKNNFSNDFLSSENRKIVEDVNKTILKNKKSIDYILNIKISDEKEKIFNIISTPIYDQESFIGIFSIVKDITYEEKIKENFVSKHFQLKSLLENIPVLVFMQDSNLNFLASSKPSKNITFNAFNDVNIEKLRAEFEDRNEDFSLIKNNKSLIKEKEISDTKGIPHWYKIYKIPINDYSGNISGLITMANNIDSEKQLQAQKRTFVASLGHDLKNPTIAQIRGLELLLKGSFGVITKEQREIIEMVLDSCRYMNGMLASLLATYRNYESGVKLTLKEFSLEDLVMECVGEMTYVAKDKNVGISINSKITKQLVTADRVQIKRVIMNLLSNGIKYAFKDSTIKLNIYEEENMACFNFENCSPYIPKEKQQAIFAQYVTYASAHKELGLGLGLYASKKIIEGHNGEIFVDSQINNRNIFGFKIPVMQSESSIKAWCF